MYVGLRTENEIKSELLPFCNIPSLTSIHFEVKKQISIWLFEWNRFVVKLYWNTKLANIDLIEDFF